MISLRSGFDVELYAAMGSDQLVCDAARVSTLGAAAVDTEESAGLINFLMSNRHGSPFEHGAMVFRITAPIFVWREFMRHRIGFSYNEESGRYKVLDGVFYVPSRERPLVQVGKAGHYTFIEGTDEQYEETHRSLVHSYDLAWQAYMSMLESGVAKEVSRMCLPVATYSSAFVTCNPRSIMSFLSLRTKDARSTYRSYPQWEIDQVARKMEEIFAYRWPITHETFNKNGRVSP